MKILLKLPMESADDLADERDSTKSKDFQHLEIQGIRMSPTRFLVLMGASPELTKVVIVVYGAHSSYQ